MQTTKLYDENGTFLGEKKILSYDQSVLLNKWIDEFNLKIFHKEKENIKKEEITEKKETKLYCKAHEGR